MERTVKPRADMSLTWICPLDAPVVWGWGVAAEPDAVDEDVLVEGDDDDGVLDLF
jgi:hypothetical protein